MAMVPVKSSNIAAIGYEPATELLTVQFHGGQTWEYRGVPADVHSALMAAKSVGGFFNANVKMAFAGALASKKAADAEVEDQWSRWRVSLASKGTVPQDAKENDPWSGFWRKSERGADNRKRFVPVAIWRDEAGALHCIVNGRHGGHDEAISLWAWVSEAITEETYKLVAGGGNWPDIDATVAEQLNGGPPSAGHNQPPTDPAEILREQLEAASKAVDDYAKITDDVTLAKAQSLRSRLLELKGSAEKQHKAEKEPHLEAGRVVDRRWLPLSKDADTAAKRVRASMEAWETEKLRRLRVKQQEEEAARLKAEQEVRDADVTLAASAPVQDAPPLAPPPAAPPTQIRGAYGKGASSKPVNVVTGVTDWPALFNHFREFPEVQALLTKLAQQAVTAGRDVPGVTVEERAKVA